MNAHIIDRKSQRLRRKYVLEVPPLSLGGRSERIKEKKMTSRGKKRNQTSLGMGSVTHQVCLFVRCHAQPITAAGDHWKEREAAGGREGFWRFALADWECVREDVPSDRGEMGEKPS